MMKINRLLLILTALSIPPALFASRQEAHGRSTFLPRQLFNNLSIAETGWHSLIHSRKKNNFETSFQAIGAYQKSGCKPKVNRYFAPCRTSSIAIAGDSAPTACARNVRAEWLMSSTPGVENLSTSFYFEPTQKQYGALLQCNQTVKSIIKSDFFENMFIDISAPLQCTTSHLELKSTSSHAENALISEAFNNPDWCTGKAACKREHTDLAELRLRWGQVFTRENIFEFIYYSGVSFPTGHKANPCYWFDAVNGFNGCYGINGGMQMQFLLNREPSNANWYFFVNVDDIFLIRRHQLRTYDLYDKPWSRFMLYNRISPNCTATNVPGVNIFTIDSVVRPYNIADFSTGWRFATKNCEFECGYNVWGHGDETIKVRYPDEFCAEWGIAGSTAGTSASASTIAQQAANDVDSDDAAVFITIPVSQLDPCSAATSSALTQKVHGAITIQHTGTKMSAMFSTGGFYEFAQKNGSFNLWGIWGKVGCSF
jgi:hypothetical protein